MSRRDLQLLREALLTEMPIRTFKAVGDFSKELSFKDPVDRRLLTSPAAVEKIRSLWSRTPYTFDIYVVNRRSVNQSQFREYGQCDLDFVRSKMKLTAAQIPDNDPSAITVIYTNNEGDKAFMASGWILAHRMGHAFATGRMRGEAQEMTARWDRYTDLLRDMFNKMMKDVYGREITGSDWVYSNRTAMDALRMAAQMIGTMRSARNKELNTWWELSYELLAQYLITGHIEFNPSPDAIPPYLWSPQGLQANDPEAQANFDSLLEGYARAAEILLREVLNHAVGKIFVM